MDILTEKDGRTLPADDFVLTDCKGSPTTETIRGLLSGSVVAALFRQAVGEDTCAEIVSRYRSSPHLRRRTDGVPASYIGTYHYLKHPRTYIEECVARRSHVEALTQGLPCPIRVLQNSISAAAAVAGQTFRPARYEGKDAIAFVAREWEGSNEYSLSPHEDLSQLRSEIQMDFEISKSYAPISFNVCLANAPARGRTIIWNLVPSERTIDHLGLTGLGYPIPPELLSNVPSLAIPVAAGDVLAFNSSFVHAVEGIDPASIRTTLAFSAAIISSSEVVAWT